MNEKFPLDLQCVQCGTRVGKSTESRRYLWRKTGRIFCTTKCGMSYREAHLDRSPSGPEVQRTTCSICGVEMAVRGWTLTRLRSLGRAYCSKTCSSVYRSQRSSETIARTNRQYASERMTARNPMARAEIRQKVSETHKRNGLQPKERGGNGRPIPEGEAMLMAIVGSLGFFAQLAIKTGQPRGTGYPPCYKVDAGNDALKIALEADGTSHGMLVRKAQDLKKDELLAGLGWTVLRFTNAEILGSPENVWTTVMSIISKSKGYTHTSPRA